MQKFAKFHKKANLYFYSYFLIALYIGAVLNKYENTAEKSRNVLWTLCERRQKNPLVIGVSITTSTDYKRIAEMF